VAAVRRTAETDSRSQAGAGEPLNASPYPANRDAAESMSNDRPRASNDQRLTISTLIARPGADMSPTATTAPAKRTWGKQIIGRASVAWAASATAAEASRPRAKAASDSMKSVTKRLR